MPGELVNVDNFVRAETDRMFAALSQRAGGTNRWDHSRQPVAIEDQTVIRSNRDTLYSIAIVDISNGATVTIPDAATAAGWGGLPDHEAFYVNVDPQLPVGDYELTVRDVPVDAFWSVSIYNADGYFEPNDRNAYSLNSITAVPNDDGSVTIHFGTCDDDRPNCLPS